MSRDPSQPSSGNAMPRFSRGCRALDVVGADVVTVSRPYDPSGNTALPGANLLYEMPCVLTGVRYR